MRHTFRTSLRTTTLAVALAGLLGPAAGLAETVKLPETTAEHAAMADQYEAKGKAWRAEVEFHQQMMAEYKKSHPDRKSGARSQAAIEMEKHCKNIIAHAKPLADEADFMVRYHRARAKELEGK